MPRASWRLNGTDVHTLEAGSPCTVDIDVDVAAAIADATVTLQIGRDAIALWEGSVRADLEPRAYRVEFELASLPLSSGTYEVALTVTGAGGLRSTAALDPGLVIGPGADGGPIVAARHSARVTER